jgi:two-component system chemotaxis response regulator CheY
MTRPAIKPQKRQQRVLVVDDNAGMRDIVSLYMDEFDVCVQQASDGLEAIELLQKFKPDVMVLDINMPHLDGFGVLRHIRERSLDRVPHTLMLTARNDHDDARKSIELGACDYLAKPFESKQLVSRIARLLIQAKTS